jgi:hypothetical protein
MLIVEILIILAVGAFFLYIWHDVERCIERAQRPPRAERRRVFDQETD